MDTRVDEIFKLVLRLFCRQKSSVSGGISLAESHSVSLSLHDF